MNFTVKSSASQKSLDEIAKTVKQEHLKFLDYSRNGVWHAVLAGRALLEAKSQVKHGDWLDWLEIHCECSSRQATRYMQLANKYPNATRASDLEVQSIRQAMKQLADPDDEGDTEEGSEDQANSSTGSAHVEGNTRDGSDDEVNSANDAERVSNVTTATDAERDSGEANVSPLKNTDVTKQLTVPTQQRTSRDQPLAPRATAVATKQLQKYLTFAPETPEANIVISVVDEVRKMAGKHAKKLINSAMQLAHVNQDTVARAMLREVTRKLASDVGLTLADVPSTASEETSHE